MAQKTSALYSEYIIDGVNYSLAPAAILNDCLLPYVKRPVAPTTIYDPIMDETVDPCPSNVQYDIRKVDEYLARTVLAKGQNRLFNMRFPEEFTRSRVAKSIIDTLWLKGHFRLSDLALSAAWKWNQRPLGNMASLYFSVESAADYIDSLGLNLINYSYSESQNDSEVSFKVKIAGQKDAEFEDEDAEEPLTDAVKLGRKRCCLDHLQEDKESWIIYIPFDTCDFRLGGSVLSDSFGAEGSIFPTIQDPDYLIDCYEVVRELVEDGVVISGATVGDGGLLTALQGMCGDSVGAKIDINDIMNAYEERGMVRILFAEVPGVIIQIKDMDYDYVDAELLLQDVAWYPLGHPIIGDGKISVVTEGPSGIAGILQSLMSSGASEGED